MIKNKEKEKIEITDFLWAQHLQNIVILQKIIYNNSKLHKCILM
jgi:hypothetical protein